MSDDADAARPPRMRGMRHAGCTATGPAAATRATVRLPALSHACMAYALFGESRMRLRYGMGGHRAEVSTWSAEVSTWSAEVSTWSATSV